MTITDPRAVEATTDDRTLFFTLLAVATLVPYLLFISSSHVLPRSAGLDDAQNVVIFFAAGGHVAASFFFYGDRRVRSFMLDGRRTRYVYVPVALVLGTGLAYAVLGVTGQAYLVVAYWIWQNHHYTRQNHGILAFSSRASGTGICDRERLAITLTGVSAILAMLTYVTPYQSTFLADYAWVLRTTSLGVMVVAWGVYLSTLADPVRRRPGLRAGMLLLLMLFYVPVLLFDDAFSAVFTYAMAHGLQYLVFLYFVASPRQDRRRHDLGLVILCCVGGALLMKVMERGGVDLWGGASDFVFGAYLGVVMWHFVLDAGLWRLSEPFQRSYMSERFDFLAPKGSDP